MKERPILFSGPLVRAILEDRKTQTRRVITSRNTEAPRWGGRGEVVVDASQLRCRIQPGDRLWVRETWADVNSPDGPAIAYRADGAYRSWHEWCAEPGSDHGAGPSMNYEAYPGDYVMWVDDLLARDEHKEDGYRWKPSIHMPRWASRITLEVIDVRAERVQDITPSDAIAEGVRCWMCNGRVDGTSEEDCGCFHSKAEAVPSFQVVWDEINAKRGYSWESNPWVWAITFRRLQP